MARKRNAPGRKDKAEGAPQEAAINSPSGARSGPLRGSVGEFQPPIPCKVAYACPVCDGGNADATWTGDRWLIGCFTASCRDLGGTYLQELGEALGLSRGAAKDELAAALRAYTGQQARPVGEAPPLPSRKEFKRWNGRFKLSRRPKRWCAARGIHPDVAYAAGVGWDYALERLTLPAYSSRGALVAAKWRSLVDGAQLRAWPGNGRPWPLWPRTSPWEAPDEDWSGAPGEPTFLCASEWDALCLQSHGAKAFSVTLGAGSWRDEWTEEVRAIQPVIVAYHVGEERQSAKVIERLWAANVTARRLDLRRFGMTEHNADVSDYLNGGGMVAALLTGAVA